MNDSSINKIKLTKKKMYLIDLIMIIFLLVIDQLSKHFVSQWLCEVEAYPIIPEILELRYQINTGGAWGILQNQTFFFVFVAFIILSCIFYILIKIPDKKKYNALHITLSLIAAGAIGNMIDRIIQGYVVDFIYVKVIRFPIFNVADIYVTLSAITLIILFIFKYQENDLSFLDIKQKKYREIK